MESKVIKKKLKKTTQTKMKSLRMLIETYNIANQFVEVANHKKVGGKIKIHQVLDLAVRLLNESHIPKLQSDSLKNSDRQELMRQRYIKQFGEISKEDYIGFTMTTAYVDFLSHQNNISEFDSST